MTNLYGTINTNLGFEFTYGVSTLFLLAPRSEDDWEIYPIRETLQDATVFDLLNGQDFLYLTENPSHLEHAVSPDTRIVVINEIQKAPQLLDEVHRLIETKDVRFLLTASSARKLRRGGVNLLGDGRAPFIFTRSCPAKLVKTLAFREP